MKGNKTLMCELFAIMGNTCWGLSNLWLTIAQGQADTKIILSSRFFFAFLILNILLLTGKQKINLKGKPLLPLLALVTLEPISFYLESYGVLYSGVTLTSITLAVIPVLTIVCGSIFLKEVPAKKQLLSCAIPMIGVMCCALASGKLSGGNAKGLILLAGNVIALTAFRVINRKAATYYTAFERTYALITVCLLTFTTSALLDINGDISVYAQAWSKIEFIGPVLILAVFSSVVANMLINYATAHISIAKTSAYSNLTTVVAAFAGIVILHERVTTGMILGMMLIVIGVMMVNHYDASNAQSTKKVLRPKLARKVA